MTIIYRFGRLINHHRPVIVMYGLTESPLSRNDRFPGENNPKGIVRIKTNPLPLATKDCLKKRGNPERKKYNFHEKLNSGVNTKWDGAFLQIKQF